MMQIHKLHTALSHYLHYIIYNTRDSKNTAKHNSTPRCTIPYMIPHDTTLHYKTMYWMHIWFGHSIWMRFFVDVTMSLHNLLRMETTEDIEFEPSCLEEHEELSRKPSGKNMSRWFSGVCDVGHCFWIFLQDMKVSIDRNQSDVQDVRGELSPLLLGWNERQHWSHWQDNG